MISEQEKHENVQDQDCEILHQYICFSVYTCAHAYMLYTQCVSSGARQGPRA